MRKRIWALVLCAVLVCSLLPMQGFALGEEAILIEKTQKSYAFGLEASQQESFHGLCGTMVGYQLQYFGVTTYPERWDGNLQFDKYAAQGRTSGGYYVEAYPATEFSLEEALLILTENGTKNVDNILVGFETTNTEAGSIYGHASVITGIYDGIVYFAESFDTAYGPEGTVIRLTIHQFAEFYNGWANYEGLVHFCDNYTDACVLYGTDLFVRTRFSQSLRSQPRLVGREDCVSLRTLSPGERLWVDGVVKDPDGKLYYRVLDGEQVGYILAKATVLERVNAEELSVTEDFLPDTLEPNTAVQISGTVSAKHGLIGAVELVVTDSKNQTLLQQKVIVDNKTWELEGFAEELQKLKWEKGSYRIALYGQTASAYVKEGALDYTHSTILLEEKTLFVGMKPRVMPGAPGQRDLDKNGWFWENGTWYYYENGRPGKGWVRNLGVRYYLQEDGSVTTGWVEVDGTLYCFSATGALCTGWLTTDEGTRYAFSDGTFAEGWQSIGSARYYFDQGIMQTSGRRTDGEVEYTFQRDGKAIPRN